MGLMNKFKSEVLNQSDLYNNCKNENRVLKSENEKLNKKNRSLKKKLKKSKRQMKSKDMLIKSLLSGNKKFDENYCPLCNNVNTFKTFGKIPRSRARCTNCRSLERHRFIYLVFNQKFPNIFDNECKMLHFAPERPLYNKFRKIETLDYHTVDLDPDHYEKANIHITKKVNMEDISYDDETFDIVYNSHVLEHIPNDIGAMRELHRVLKSDGICFIMVPISDLPETLENDEYNTPELRLKYYDQEDHLRKYGQDFKDRLISAGFKVEVLKSEDFIDDFKVNLYSIRNETLFICRK